jgi:hypothetical protein
LFFNVILNVVKDPMVFSNNQQSLLWMGFFANAQNDSLYFVILRTSAPAYRQAGEGSLGFQQ